MQLNLAPVESALWFLCGGFVFGIIAAVASMFFEGITGGWMFAAILGGGFVGLILKHVRWVS